LNRVILIGPAVAGIVVALLAGLAGPAHRSAAGEVCTSYPSTDVPKDIAPMFSTVVSSITVADSFSLSDINFGPINISHSWISDIDAYLWSPNNTRVELFTNVGSDGDDMLGTVLDDAAAESIANAMPPFAGAFRPEGELARFDSEDSAGVWQLELRDRERPAEIGTLDSWALELCRTVTQSPTPSVTATAAPTPTATPVPTPTRSAQPTGSPSPAPTGTSPAVTPTATLASTPSLTPTALAATFTPEPTASPSPVPSPGADSDGDTLSNETESACGSDLLVTGSRPERVDTPADDDADTLVNESLPASARAFDCDGDGYVGLSESHVTTSDQDPCGGNGWPSDVFSGGFQANTVNVQDLANFLTPVRRLGTGPGHPDFGPRWDLVPGGTIGGAINVQDLAAMIAGASGHPPMFHLQRAFGKPCPWPP
jgi:subtilisin-like proprotein convertase family protein